jgi:hypothetical protein
MKAERIAGLEQELETFPEQQNTEFMRAEDFWVVPLSFWWVKEDSNKKDSNDRRKMC